MSDLVKLAFKFIKTIRSNDTANTAVDKLSYSEIGTYMQSAGIQFNGPVEGDQLGFTFNGKKYAMQIISAAFIRFAPLENSNGQIWEVPSPQQTVKRAQYFGKDMPFILKMIINTINVK